MSQFFKVVGILTLVGSLVLFFLTLSNLTLWNLLGVFSCVTLGMALIEIGDLMERVSDLESRLDPPPEEPEEDDIQKVVCPSCYKKYDLDSPKCPYCGMKNDLW